MTTLVVPFFGRDAKNLRWTSLGQDVDGTQNPVNLFVDGRMAKTSHLQSWHANLVRLFVLENFANEFNESALMRLFYHLSICSICFKLLMFLAAWT